jgi:hypothetical protein
VLADRQRSGKNGDHDIDGVEVQADMNATDENLERWFEQFVRRESAPDMIEAWAERTTTSILEESAEVVEDAVLSRLLRAAVRAHWTSFLTQLTEPAREVRLVKPAVEFAAGLAQRQIHLATLFKVHRIAQQATWQYVTEVVGELSGGEVDDTAVLVHFWGRASTWIDESITASLDIYQAESERIRQGAAAHRLDTVRQALDGTIVDARELSAALGGYPVSAFNTAVIVHTSDNDAVAELERVATQLAADLGARHPLVVSPGGRERWCWVGTRALPDIRRLNARADQLRDQGMELYVGTPAEGINGFAQSHREARSAQSIAFQAQGDGPVTLFPDIEVLALISHAGDAARRFAARTLGPLAEASQTAQRLRETLQTTLDSANVDEAARKLSVHKNTVRYRLAQAEEVLGHPITQAPVELALALRYHATFLAGDGA